MPTRSTIVVEDILEVLGDVGLKANETLTISGAEANRRSAPHGLHKEVITALSRSHPQGLYSHQAAALRHVLDGHDLCLATPTASGKSLVFMTAAADFIAKDRSARVLALYPAKALIQDQLMKWKHFLESLRTSVGFIDGSVPTASRYQVLASSQVVAMTPDVVHAWLMSNLGKSEVLMLLNHLRLVVLDEAHVYDGAFGTNMAYLLRRLATASSPYRFICSTATVGTPEKFLKQLTGRRMMILDEDDDGSASFRKTLVRVEVSPKDSFERTVKLLSRLATYGRARFLAFADSRKLVEHVVGAIRRENLVERDGAEEESNDNEFHDWPRLEHVLPYRAGYEKADREAIQKALTDGTLAGVVSTSAMELGLDIGDLDVVVLLNTPPTVKSFRQRIGRAGRTRDAVCILVDNQGVMAPLPRYLERPPEPGWLYLDNRYIQYSNALCAAVELQATGIASAADLDFHGLPETFRDLVENELNPTAAVDNDLYVLKQRAQANPHYEFPIRSAGEPNFEVKGPHDLPLGTLSYGQALREAYPGAVYYYMARPFRVKSLEYRRGLVKASDSRRFTTKPDTDTMAFPDFHNGLMNAWKSPAGFVAEVELQVNERVKGFVERRGSNTLPTHEYGPGSPYSQKSLSRLFRTTGVCWAFPGESDRSHAVAECLMQIFAQTCGIHERDLGTAFFHANEGPFVPGQVKGAVVFDATNGSLRLTERMASEFGTVIAAAIAYAESNAALVQELRKLRELVDKLEPTSNVASGIPSAPLEDDWIRVIDRGYPGMYVSTEAPVEVKVLDFRYTPRGLMYQLEPLREPGYSMHVTQSKSGSERKVVKNSPAKWMVVASAVRALGGRSKTVMYNVVSGETRPDGG